MRSIGPTGTAGDASVPSKSLSRLRRFVRFAMLVLCLVTVLIGAGFLWFVRLMPTSEIVLARNADGIVVLTGAALRISDALDLLAAGRGRRLLISGVNPATRSREISRLIPVHQRWFTCCVDLDYSATNTIGNAVETRRWVLARDFKSMIVVTSNFHMPRAMAELAHQLPDVALVPFPVVSDKMHVETWWDSPSTARLLFVEYLKYIVAKVRIGLRQTFA